MKLLPSTIDILRCPVSKAPLRLEGDSLVGGAVPYPVRDGIPRFVKDDSYAGNFSFEWQNWNRTQFDTDSRNESEETFREKTGFTPEMLRGKRILDVGVGAGRFADVAARWGAEVVGVDISYAVEAAGKNLSRYPNAQVIQADIFKLPFADESFDYIFSIGVLHHTPDCEKAFRQLPRLLKPGGQVVIWLYHAHNDFERFNELYRSVAQRLPQKAIYALSHVAIPGYYLFQVPVLRSVMNRFLPHISMHPDWRWRVLDTFDWYSPKYQSHHTYPEVFAWFKSEGLVDIEVLEPLVTVRGTKPSA